MIAASSSASTVSDFGSVYSPTTTAFSTRLKQGAIASLCSLAMVAGIGEGTIAAPEQDPDGRTRIVQTDDVYEIFGGFNRSDGEGGGNLFHSFERFDISEPEQVIFRRGNDFENIIGRVVGSDSSLIDGLLSVDGTANLFLLNPNGIVFGENAQLDLRGSFIASTADEISFGEAGSFSFDGRRPNSELTITPDALVFNQLANRPDLSDIGDRTIRVERPDLDVTPGLEVNPRRSLMLAGGSVNIQGGILQAPQGRVEIVALADEAELILESSGNRNRIFINRDEFPAVARADVTLARGALIDVTGQNQGDVTIYGQDISLRNLSSICGGIGPGTACTLFQSTDNVPDNFFSRAIGSGTSVAGNIVLNASREVALARGSQIANIIYFNSTAQEVANSRDAVDNFLTLFGSQGTIDFDQLFGSIIIFANEIDIGEEEGVGDIAAQLNTSTFGTGSAGTIFLLAIDSIDIRGLGRAPGNTIRPQLFSSVETGATGDAGGVEIIAGSLTLSEFAGITASTRGDGSPGNVNIVANNLDTTTGNDGIVRLLDGSTIFSNVELGGDAGFEVSQQTADIIGDPSAVRTPDEGAINVTAGEVTLSGGAQLQTLVRGATTVDEAAQGNGGNIRVDARKLTIEGERSSLFSSVGTNATGDGGAILVDADLVILDNGSLISAETDGNDTGAELSTGGAIVVFSDNLFVNQRSNITASASGKNTAGGIFVVTSGLQVISDGGSIQANTNSGNGGNIFTFGGGLFLINGSNIETEAGEDGGFDSNGGNIVLGLNIIQGYPSNNSNISASAPEGRGGQITTGRFFLNLQDIAEREQDFDFSNDIVATGGVADGTVTINEFDVDPVRGVFELPALVVDVESLLTQVCPGPGQRASNELSALYVTGRGGIPPSVSDRPNTNDIVADWVSLPNSANGVATLPAASESTVEDFDIRAEPDAVEAQELVQDANGELWLVADASAAAVPPATPNVCPS